MQNYFNYFTEIEERFQQRRGSLLMLSTLDWALIETWREAGVPLEAVLRGIDSAFDKHDAKAVRAKARVRKVNGLAWCSQSVMEAVEQAREASIGASTVTGADAVESGFEAERVAAYLEENALKIVASALRAPADGVAAEVAARLRALAVGLRAEPLRSLEELDRTLTVLEEKMFAALVTSADEDEMVALREQAARELAPYRGKMQATQIKQVQQQFLQKRMLEARKLPRLSLFYEPPMKLQIEKVVYGGAGLGYQSEGADAGKAVFVPFTLQGEKVEAALSRDKSGYGEASLVRVIDASPERVAAKCRHFGECGGCQLQHAAYEAQVRMKAEILLETLERAGLGSLPEVQVHTGESWGYRNRIRLRVGVVEGAIRLGYNRRGGNAFLPIRECPIAAPLLWRAASALLRLAECETVVERWMRAAVEVEFFTNADESKLQMTVFVRKTLSSGFDDLCKLLKASVPELVGAGVSILAKEAAQKRRRDERPVAGVRWGAEGLLYTAAGADYWVSRGGFFQVNRFLVDEMVQIVTEGRRGGLAWDLYAGVGLFSRALARGFERIVAVEGDETAAADLGRALKGAGMRAVRASTVEFLRDAVVQREKPELVVMDPPRAGVGAEVCALLARVGVGEMVYVSCDPVTLSRDLRAMVDSGYRIKELHLVDMFPQTFHLETVAMLRR